MSDYQTILSAAGVGVGVLAVLWRMNSDLKRDLKQDVGEIRKDLKQDMAEIRQTLTLGQENLTNVRERVARLEPSTLREGVARLEPSTLP